MEGEFQDRPFKENKAKVHAMFMALTLKATQYHSFCIPLVEAMMEFSLGSRTEDTDPVTQGWSTNVALWEEL